MASWTVLTTARARRGLCLAALLALGAALVITPWTVRNYAVFNAFVPIGTISGRSPPLGNSDNTRWNTGVMSFQVHGADGPPWV